jgi:hypothetical protein
MIHLVSHLLVAYVVFVEPWLGYRLYDTLKAQVAAGVADAKLQFYGMIVIHQVVVTVLVLAIWRLGSILGTDLGLCLPTSWQILLPFMAGFVPAAGVAMLLLRIKRRSPTEGHDKDGRRDAPSFERRAFLVCRSERRRRDL